MPANTILINWEKDWKKGKWSFEAADEEWERGRRETDPFRIESAAEVEEAQYSTGRQAAGEGRGGELAVPGNLQAAVGFTGQVCRTHTRTYTYVQAGKQVRG